MRYLRYAFLGALAVCLITLALANSGPVTLNLLPEDVALVAGFSASVTLPLFIVILGSMIAGLLIGFVWEWFREHKHRAEASRERRERERLEREVKTAKRDAHGGDEVLALLDDRKAS